MPLTDLWVRKIPPKTQRFEVLDGNGLYIRVMPTGRKSWVFRYNFEGNARRMTLGSYPTMTLSQAREKHALALQDVERGIGPGLKAQAEKAKRKDTGVPCRPEPHQENQGAHTLFCWTTRSW